MSPKENKSAIQGIYAAFGRGDIPAVLDALTDDIEWTFHGPPEIPYAGRHRGRDAIARFFTIVSEVATIKEFVPQKFLADEETVAVLGRERVTARRTGREFDVEWIHVFVFRGDRVAEIFEFTDTAALAAAYGT
jgi:ketosteroid isomerase-like protein